MENKVIIFIYFFFLFAFGFLTRRDTWNLFASCIWQAANQIQNTNIYKTITNETANANYTQMRNNAHRHRHRNIRFKNNNYINAIDMQINWDSKTFSRSAVWPVVEKTRSTRFDLCRNMLYYSWSRGERACKWRFISFRGALLIINYVLWPLRMRTKSAFWPAQYCRYIKKQNQS